MKIKPGFYITGKQDVATFDKDGNLVEFKTENMTEEEIKAAEDKGWKLLKKEG